MIPKSSDLTIHFWGIPTLISQVKEVSHISGFSSWENHFPFWNGCKSFLELRKSISIFFSPGKLQSLQLGGTSHRNWDKKPGMTPPKFRRCELPYCTWPCTMELQRFLADFGQLGGSEKLGFKWEMNRIPNGSLTQMWNTIIVYWYKWVIFDGHFWLPEGELDSIIKGWLFK